jgi:mono/diheme cytochrome c family protein
MRRFSAAAAVALAILTLGAASTTPKPATTAPATLPDTRMRSPAEELKTIILPPGYHLELVASEPDVISPTLCVWDGNGRMYVAEMRSYMLDLDGTGSHQPTSLVSRWEDTDGNGTYDRHTIFADHLLLPRMVLPLDDRVLIRETDTKDIYSYRDLGGDGHADLKKRIYEGGKQEGNLEHQPSGLIWDIDNWLYVTNQDERFRFTRGKIEKEQLPFHPGQWGIATDDTGRLIFATAGSERPAHNFQVMPQYGDINLPGQLGDDFTEVFPIEHLTDVQGGLPRLKPGGGLNRFTACCGGSIYRGDALPADLYGDYILPEPVGRLIRRAHVKDVGGKIVITNAYDHKEFIASTDANFRPVWSTTGPDGCLYFCDMYRGVIQEANWTKPDSFLRPQIEKYGLQKNINGGRIWRLVHDGYTPRQPPRMLDETAQQLVAHLSDPNGWWRDTAQKLIILRGDQSVVPTLKEMAQSNPNPLARLHALWTLEGLDSIEDDLLLAKLKDADPRLRSAAVRIAEPLMKKNPVLLDAVKLVGKDSDPGVAIQVCVSLLHARPGDADAIVNAIVQFQDQRQPRGGAVAEVVHISRDNFAKAKADEEKKKALEATNKRLAESFDLGRKYYAQTCIACHGPDGQGMPAPEHNGTTLAPPLKGSQRLMGDGNLVARLVLNGLTGPNHGKTYPGQMPAFKWASDDWLAAILTYARNEWGNKAEIVEPAQLAGARKLTADRNKPFTIEELFATSTQPSTRPASTTASR